MRTIHLSGALADSIQMSLEDPRTSAERALNEFLSAGTVRRYGRGYRLTLRAPRWVIDWIAGTAEFLASPGVDATPAERAAARKFLAAYAEL